MTTVTPIKDSEPSPGVKAMERLFVRIMDDEGYNEAEKRYKPTYNDARMAKETGLSEAHIAKLRERFFGPAGEPDEVSELRGLIDILQGEVSKIRSRFDGMCAKNGWKQ